MVWFAKNKTPTINQNKKALKKLHADAHTNTNMQFNNWYPGKKLSMLD